MARKIDRQSKSKSSKGKKLPIKGQYLQKLIDEWNGQSDYVFSVRNPEEQDRLTNVIQKFIKNNQDNDTWCFPTQISNLENLCEAANVVKQLPEFSQFHYSFSTEHNSDRSMGALYISRNHPNPILMRN